MEDDSTKQATTQNDTATQNKTAQVRTKNWATIVYPESAPTNWMDILEDEHIPALISPLHDKDLDKNGNLKKPHHHVILMFDGLKTEEQAREVFTKINGVGTEKIKSLKSYTRYLCHLDSKKKAQYSIDDIIELSGADFEYSSKSAQGKYRAIHEMLSFCNENQIDSYAELMDYARDNREDWFQVLCDSGTVPIVQYMKSRSWENSRHGEM